MVSVSGRHGVRSVNVIVWCLRYACVWFIYRRLLLLPSTLPLPLPSLRLARRSSEPSTASTRTDASPVFVKAPVTVMNFASAAIPSAVPTMSSTVIG